MNVWIVAGRNSKRRRVTRCLRKRTWNKTAPITKNGIENQIPRILQNTIDVGRIGTSKTRNKYIVSIVSAEKIIIRNLIDTTVNEGVVGKQGSARVRYYYTIGIYIHFNRVVDNRLIEIP